MKIEVDRKERQRSNRSAAHKNMKPEKQNSKAISKDTYIPFDNENIDLGEEAQKSGSEYPLLQYATGLPAQKPKLDAEGNQEYDEDTGEALIENLFYAGFFVAQGQDKELDAAMQAKKAQWLDIAHQSSNKTVRHWAFEKTSLFIMARGVPTSTRSNGELGIVYLWQEPNQTRRKGSTVFQSQIILRSLLPDYQKPLMFIMRSTQTDDARKAFNRQYNVLAKAHELRRQHGKDIDMPLWAYSALFGASKTQDIRKSSNGKESKTIFPMISGIPDDIPVAYMQRHECPRDYIDLFKICTDNAVKWAQDLTERIRSGADEEEVQPEDHPF